MTGTELRDEARAIMEKISDKKIAELDEKYDYHASKDSATDELTTIGADLFNKRVAILFLEENKGYNGSFNEKTGEVMLNDSLNPVDDKELDPASQDIANDFALAALAQDAMVFVLPHDKMPTANPVAVIDRY